MGKDWPRATIRKGGYKEKSVRDRIRAFFLDNLGKVASSEQLAEVAANGGKDVENWHQRLSELRCDEGYTIQTNRDLPGLRPGEYLMPDATRRKNNSKRVRPTDKTWDLVMMAAEESCEWNEDGARCGLHNGDTDPVGGGTVKLTPDHMTPHSVDGNADPNDPKKWRALCGRHQVMKKNFWDSTTGKMNYEAIIQAAPVAEKKKIYEMLKQFFDEE